MFDRIKLSYTPSAGCSCLVNSDHYCDRSGSSACTCVCFYGLYWQTEMRLFDSLDATWVSFCKTKSERSVVCCTSCKIVFFHRWILETHLWILKFRWHFIPPSLTCTWEFFISKIGAGPHSLEVSSVQDKCNRFKLSTMKYERWLLWFLAVILQLIFESQIVRYR